MKKIEQRREEFLKGKNLNAKIPLGIGYEAGYRDACKDCGDEFEQGGWAAKAAKIRELPDREDKY